MAKKKSSMKKGFQGIIPDPLPLPSDFPRPHRKELMESILHKDQETIMNEYNKKKEIYKAVKLAKHFSSVDISLSGDTRALKAHRNALVGAIDQGNTSHLKYVVRPPIRVPPNYEAKLRDLDSIGAIFDKLEKIKIQQEEEIKKARVQIKFTPSVAKVVEQLDSDSINTYSVRLPELIKSSTAKDLKQVEDETKAEECCPADETAGVVEENSTNSNSYLSNSRKENWSTRNVPYMLEIWQKAESSNSISSGTSRRTGEKMKAPRAKISPLADETKAVFEEIIGKKDPNNFKNISEYPSILSESTIEFLKRLSNEKHFLGNGVPHGEDEFVVERTLTGYDPKTGKHEIIESTFLPDKLITKTESPFKHVTPGKCAKEIGTYITADGDLLPFENNKVMIKSDHPFELVFPSNTPKQVVTAQEQIVATTETQEALDPAAVAEEITQQLQTQYGEDIFIPSRKDEEFYAAYKPVRFVNEPEPVVLEPEISLKKLADYARSYIKTSNCDDEQRKKLGSFLKADWLYMDTIPASGTPEFEELFKFLVYFMRQKLGKDMVFEAVCYIAILRAEHHLLRWDNQMYKSHIDEILIEGSPAQRHIACLARIRAGNTDEVVIKELWRGIGSTKAKEREMAIELISNIDSAHAATIVQFLKNDAKNPNWRIRLDVTVLLKAWIDKLKPPPLKKKPKEDPDALETDDPVLIKALFHTLNSGHNEPEEKGILGAVGVELIEDTKPYNPKHLPLFETCIDILLEQMTTDRAVQVRSAAANLLGKLKQGRAVIDWIAKSLESQDPIKRMNALKCLSLLGVLMKGNVQSFVNCLRDPFCSVRMEACRLACKLRATEPVIINALIDLLGDSEYKVRAYCVKALGLCKANNAIVRENLSWALLHDSHPAVRAEAIQAVHLLDLINTDNYVKQAVLTLLKIDKSDVVRFQAEAVLVQCGIVYPNAAEEVRKGKYTTVDGTILCPYPHILGDRTDKEVDTFLKKSLVEEQELTSVINQVHKLATKERIMKDVIDLEKKKKDLKIEGIDLDYDSSFKPELEKFHKVKRTDPLRYVKKDKNHVIVL